MIRLLTVCPSKAEIVLLREWIPPSAEDFLRRENLRLTHRISYLEDQVSELLMNVTSKDMHRDEKQTEIFQKGSHVALLAAGPKNCSKSGVSNNAGSNEKACSDLGETNQENRQGGDSINGIQRSNNIIGNVNGYIVSASSGQKYQESDIYKSCDESDKIRILTKKYESEELSVFPNRSKWVKNQDSAEENSKKHFNNLLNPKIHSTFDNSYSLSDLERPGRKSNNNLSRIYDYGSETNYSIYKSAKDKKIETDEESTNPRKYELSEKENGRSSNKPTPPKKPIRLSINRATSLQNVETCYSLQNAVRKIKRSHKGEAPPPPIYLDNKANGRDDSQYSDSGAIIKNPSRNETWKTPLESTKANFCWPANHHRSKCKADEKWC